jgi:serine protease
MKSHRYALVAVATGLLLAACSNGGGGQTPTNATLSGTITAAANIVLDSDTNDPEAAYSPNTAPATAQAIGNPIMVGGFVTALPTGVVGDRFVEVADVDDIYQVDLAAGQSVTLEVSDSSPPNDLDLGLYDSAGVLLDASVGVARFENVTASAAGRYFLRVTAFSGRSNYLLTVGTGAMPVAALRLASEFVPGEAVVVSVVAAGNAAVSSAGGGYTIKSGGVERPMLVAFDSVKTASASGLPTQPQGFSVDAWQAGKLDTLYRIKALRGRPDLAGADPNYLVRPLKTPNDPFYAYQWHYPLINLPQAWDVTTGTPAAGDVVVAVVDTGVRLSHADLAANLLKNGAGAVVGYDFIRDVATANDGDAIDADADDPGDESTPASSSWHGTHVAGTIAAASDNGIGVAGVAWGARIMPIRVIGKGGGTSYDVLQGIRYAAGLSNDSGTLPPRRADIVNLSLGCLNCYAATTEGVLDQVRAAGVIVVAAAGNESTGQPGYPASYRNVVSVSAVTLNRALAPYSNFGATVDVAAPGGDTTADLNGDGYADGVLSALVGGGMSSQYGYYQGTSMAAPHVSGVVALMKAVHPGLTPDQFDALLANGAIGNDLGSAGRDDNFGHGLIDAAKAVLEAKRLASGVTVTALTANPSRLDFGPVGTSATFDIARLGNGAIGVASLTDDASWLTVTAGAASTDGVGGYVVSVDRFGLPPGSYAATIAIGGSEGARIDLPVTMQVASASVGVNTGFYWVLLLDENYETVRQVGVAGSGGRYPFSFGDVAPGSYYVLAGTDSDRDDLLCDDGEACGAYPTLGEPVVIEVGGGRQGIDFSVGLNPSPSTLSTALLTEGVRPQRGGHAVSKGVGHGP